MRDAAPRAGAQNTDALGRLLREVLPPERILENEPLARHTSFRIGGPARWFVFAANAEELRGVRGLCAEAGEPFTLLGRGTNVLAPDGGLSGVTARLLPETAQTAADAFGGTVTADAAAGLRELANAARDAGLGGLAFAAGIPGSVGGAVCMNAGAYERCMADVFDRAQVLLPDGSVAEWRHGDMAFAHRQSALRGGGGVLLSATFRLTPADPRAVAEEMTLLDERRAAAQPLAMPSAGSVFKRPPGRFAGKLIEDCGLKGFAVGGARVSEKHAGFIVNTGNATAADVQTLIAHIRETVQSRLGVRLEPEIIFL